MSHKLTDPVFYSWLQEEGQKIALMLDEPPTPEQEYALLCRACAMRGRSVIVVRLERDRVLKNRRS
jgi:hypothetical protein